MGVSVRLSRNARVYLPFWLAVPLYLLAGVVWAAVILAAGIVWVVLAAARAVQSRAA